MALSCGRTACRPGAPAASRSAAPAVQRPSVASRAVVVRTEKEDAVRALEKQATGLRAALGGPDPSMVTVTPMATRTMESVASMGSMDGTGLMSLDKDTFWPYLKAQGSTLTVVDFYTDWVSHEARVRAQASGRAGGSAADAEQALCVRVQCSIRAMLALPFSMHAVWGGERQLPAASIVCMGGCCWAGDSAPRQPLCRAAYAHTLRPRMQQGSVLCCAVLCCRLQSPHRGAISSL